MESKNYHRTITVDAPAAAVMEKINRVDGWWVAKIDGNTEKLHDKFHVPMGSTFVDFQITELVPAKKLVWKVTDCHIPWLKDTKEWKDTEVVFELAETKGKTSIGFTHIGLVPEVECYENCKKGWDGYVTESLVKFINEGEGMPKKF